MSLKEEAKRARSLYRLIEEANKSINFAKIEIGKAIHELKEGNLYKKAVGNGIDKWNHFLKLPEINMTDYTTKKLSTIYNVYCNDLGYEKAKIQECEIDNLWYVITEGLIDKADEDKIEEIISLASSLSNFEFKEAVHDLVFTKERQYDYLVMQRVRETNNLRRVKGISSDDVLNAFKIDETIPKKLKDNIGG
jgi:hypothetical protein